MRLLLLVACLLPFAAFTQTFTPDVQKYIDYPGGTIAITDVTVIDGTGMAPKPHQTIVIKTTVVFKGGVGFDTQKILASVKGRVGLN